MGAAHAFDPRSPSPDPPVQRRALSTIGKRALVDPNAPPTPEMPWGDFIDWFLRFWQPGEHVTLLGDTGCGKSTLARHILRSRRFVTVFGTKKRDRLLDDMLKHDGYVRLPHWIGGDTAQAYPKRIIWPTLNGHQDRERQKVVFSDCMDSIFREGGWTLDFDEVTYLSSHLKLDGQTRWMLEQARSNDISLVGPAQRPAFIPLAWYSQVDHLFTWNQNDHEDADRIGSICGSAKARVMMEVAELPKYEFLYRHKDTGFRVRTKVEV